MNLQHRKASTGAPEPPRLVLTVPVPTSARRVNNRLTSSGRRIYALETQTERARGILPGRAGLP